MNKKYEGACLLKIEYILKDKNQKIKRRKKVYGNSFVQGFMKYLFARMGMIDGIQINDTGNTLRTLDATDQNSLSTLVFNPGAASTAYGLRVGTSTQAVDVEDFDLITEINEGTSAGEMQHGAVTFGAPSSDSSSTSFILTRVFSNDSGGDITVNEIGLIARMSDTGSTGRNFLFARDILGTPPTVSTGEQLTVNYTIQTNI